MILRESLKLERRYDASSAYFPSCGIQYIRIWSRLPRFIILGSLLLSNQMISQSLQSGKTWRMQTYTVCSTLPQKKLIRLSLSWYVYTAYSLLTHPLCPYFTPNAYIFPYYFSIFLVSFLLLTAISCCIRSSLVHILPPYWIGRWVFTVPIPSVHGHLPAVEFLRRWSSCEAPVRLVLSCPFLRNKI